MSEFKSQAEVWQALLDGKTISRDGFKYRINDGQVDSSLIDRDNWSCCSCSFIRGDKYILHIEPKKKKIVRMAPALIYRGEGYETSNILFESGEEAGAWYDNDFRKWLIDTHGVDVEVDDE